MKKEVVAQRSPPSDTAAGSNVVSVRSTRRRRTQVERSTETRRRLIDAAIQLVHEFGFSRLTINDVAKRAGLTSGAVQHHFSSSRELLRAVAEAVFPIFQLSIEEVASPAIPHEQRVHRLVDIYWGLYRSSEYLVFWELLFGTRAHPELREALLAMQRAMVAAAVSDLVRAFSDVRMRRTAAFSLWTFITSQLRGLALLSMFEGKAVLDADIRILKTAAYNLFVDQTKQRAGS